MMKRSYIAIAEQVPGETTWWISFPSFPGVTSAADSAAEIMAQARDALATVIEDMLRDGQHPPASIEDGEVPDYDPREYQNHLVILVPHVESVAAVGQ